jgi:hypothetical protein
MYCQGTLFKFAKCTGPQAEAAGSPGDGIPAAAQARPRRTFLWCTDRGHKISDEICGACKDFKTCRDLGEHMARLVREVPA